MTRVGQRAFTLVEAMLALFLVGLTMGMLGLLFQRSFTVLRTLDDKDRARRAGRMGLDRLSSELREATAIRTTGGTLLFEKINPNAEVAIPPLAPTPLPDGWVPPDWKPTTAYPDSERLEVRYTTLDDALIREVREKGVGAWHRQVVVVGINAFTCQTNPLDEGEIEVVMSVRDNRKVTTLTARVVCPCIKEVFK